MSLSPVAIPVASAPRTKRGLLPFIIAAVVVSAALAWWRPWSSSSQATIPVHGQFYHIVPMDLEIKVNKDGELQAISYTDVKSEVEGSTQILTVVPEGATVHKGDELVKLDASLLTNRKEQMDLDLRRAESALKQAKEMKDIQESQNAANKDAADVSKELAQIDLQQYQEGTYPQTLENDKTALDMAQITLKNKEEDLDQTNQLFAKGFVTPADVKKAELDVRTAKNDVEKAKTALLVLEKYQHQMDIAKLKSAYAQSEQGLARTMRQNASYLAQRLADLDEKEQSLALLRKQAQKLQDQIDACTIRAPEDGLVIYASSIDRNLREPVQEGSTVRLSQWLLRLPDVRTMKAVLRIPESQKPKLDEKKNQRALVKILGVAKPIGATLTKVSILPDNGQRWFNPDLREYPVELLLDETPPGLKPGVRVENAEIFIDRFEQVTAVPLTSLYSVGKDIYVFVKNGEDVKERKVTIGAANETHVQITDGLNPGEDVLLLQPGQGRQLLERAGIKVADVPSTRPSKDAPRHNRRIVETPKKVPALASSKD
jgi:HlyD family secretion protein